MRLSDILVRLGLRQARTGRAMPKPRKAGAGGVLRPDQTYATETGPGPGPDFICIGQQKAGTRWLYDQLAVRPDVWMPPIKELNFLNGQSHKPTNVQQLLAFQEEFDAGRADTLDSRDVAFVRRFMNYPDHVDDIEWYSRLFKPKGPLISGDISPYYSWMDSKAAAGVLEAFPAAKIILLIREPVSRVWSSLCMRERKGLVTAEAMCSWDALEVLLQSPALRQQSFPTQIWDHWAAHLPPEQIRYWFLEDIATRPQHVVDEVCDFLGLAPGPGPIAAGYNRKEGNRKIEMPSEIRQRLAAYFAQEHERAAALFGSHAIGWRDRYRAASGSPRPMA